MSATRSGNGRSSTPGASGAGIGSVSAACQRSRCSVVVASMGAMNRSLIREGTALSGAKWMRKASVSIDPPPLPSMRTRMLHQRFDSAEHHRESVTCSPQRTGSSTSITVRRTTQPRWFAPSATASRCSKPMSCR
ncbi:Uncharacterised protein [Mycobacteroides abscessus subsp. abscessus]|nr:Uncharacterised protein [Mycobacteroides abscessus subsp. abscessus]